MEDLQKNGDVEVNYCLACGFRHQTFLPTEGEVNKYYSDDEFYKKHSPVNWFDKEIKEHQRGLWNGYYDYKLKLLKMPKHAKYNEVPLLLDVGCGSGFFLKRARYQWHNNVYGFEPSETARKVNDLWCVYKEDKWGMVRNVHMSLVLEHLPHPKDELEKWYDRMIPGSRMMIVVPNEYSPLQDKLGTNHFISNVHLNYFTPATLYGLMERSGFKVEHWSTTFPMELFPLAGLDYRKSEKTGKFCHEARLRFEQLFGTHAFDLYKKVFTPRGWGREIIMVGVR